MLRVRVIGECTIETSHGRITPGSEVFFALALVLAAERGRRLHRDWLIELLWPQEPTVRARHNLRQLLYRLNRQYGVPIKSISDSITLAEEAVHLDFVDAPPDGVGVDDERLALPGGLRILPGYQVLPSDALQEWFAQFLHRAEGETRRQLTQAIGRARAASQWDRMERLSRNFLQLDPLNELATIALAEALAISGSKAKAVQLLQEYEEEVGAGVEGRALVLAPSLLRKRINRAQPIITHQPGTEQLVGRDGIVRTLRDRLEAAMQGVGGVELVVGVQGSGKTRLLGEICAIATLDGLRTIQSTPTLSRDDVPGGTLLAIVKQLLGAQGAMGTDPEALAVLRQATGVNTEHEHGVAFGADALLAATIDLLRSVLWEHPYCIAVDDIDRADSLSISMLQRAASAVSGDRLLVLATSCDSLATTLRLSPAHLHVLQPLSSADVKVLAQRAMSVTGHPTPDSWLDELAATSTGQPWDVLAACEACLRGVHTDGSLSLATYLRERVMRLDIRCRRILLTVSLLGSDCTLALLTHTTQTSLTDLESTLLFLASEGFVTVTGDGHVTMHSHWSDSVQQCVDSHELSLRRFAVAVSLQHSLEESASPSPLHQLRAADLYRTSGDPYAAETLVQSASSSLADRGLGWTASVPIVQALATASDLSSWKSNFFAALDSAQDIQDVSTLERLLHAARSHTRKLSSLLTPTEEIALRIVQLEFDVMTLRDAETISLDCAELLADGHLSPEQRSRVALIAIKAADHINDYPRVRLLGTLLPSSSAQLTPRDRVRQQNAWMAVALAHGDIATATDMADAMVNCLDDSLSRLDRASALLNARIPFIYDCDYARIQALLASADNLIVSKYSSTLLAIRILDAEATVAIETLQVEKATELIERCFYLASSLGYSSLEVSLAETRMRLMVASRSTDSGVASASRVAIDYGRFERSRMYTCANSIILAARSGAKDQVQQLLPESKMHASRLLDGTPLDYPLVAYAVGLVATGKSKLARDTIREYSKKKRKARHSPSPLCVNLLEEFSIATPE